MLTSAFSIAPGPLVSEFDACCQRLDSLRFATALWNRRPEIWSPDGAVQKLVANRLGWVQAIDFVLPLVPRLRAFAQTIPASGFTDVVLLGMGGSSLAPEVMRQVLGRDDGRLRFRVLDSVDPDAVRNAMARSASTLFVWASKSGSTIEPNVMAEEAKRRVIADGYVAWGARFIAITDPDTALHRRAIADGFRDVFVNPPDIGGRYSALSLFGMVPAALMEIDIDRLLARAREMETACRLETARDNPGLALGAFIAAGARVGRDKMTLRVEPRLQSFGLWVEQLVAESTGKQGKGIVPVTGEPGDVRPGGDRVLVTLSLGGEADRAPSAITDRPLAALAMEDTYGLGAEFLRWEVATAAAGLLLDINPFDEPNVQQAKDATRVLLERYREHRQLPFPEAHGSSERTRLTLTVPAITALEGEPAERFLQLAKGTDYVAVLAYLPSEDAVWEPALQAFRRDISSRTGGATTLGYGPRYLHSTGQLHKGGASNGVFVIITAEPEEDLPIPGEPYSFGVLETAQALGDFESLNRTGRRALLARLPQRDPDLFARLAQRLTSS